jgi:hypothetical protein
MLRCFCAVRGFSYQVLGAAGRAGAVGRRARNSTLVL